MRRGLQVVLTIVGTVMLVAGAIGVIIGVDTVPDAGPVSENVDSEMRFFAAWYASAGVVLLWVIPRVETASTVIRIIGITFFVAGCARLLSLVTMGKPHSTQLILMVIELALPAIIIPWQSTISVHDDRP